MPLNSPNLSLLRAWRLAAVALLLAAGMPAMATTAGSPALTGKSTGQILAAGDRRVLVLGLQGEVLWEYPTQLTHDVWKLANGNVLFADGETVTEVTPAKRVVFQYRPALQEGGGAYACQRLPDGRTLIGENSTGRVLEVDAQTNIVFSLQTTPSRPKEHHNMRMARKLANGNYLVCHSGQRQVKEYTPAGKVVWEVTVPGRLAYAAVRTSENTTLVSSLEQITEYDAAGRAVWQCATGDLKDVQVRNLTGFHRLPDGSLLIGCYQAYQDGQGCGLLRVSRDRQVLWSYSHPQSDTTMMPVQALSAEGQCLPGPCLR
jgi:hypothetical protein